MTRILSHVFFLTLLSPIKNIACITLHMVGLTLRRDAIFWPRDLSACRQCQQRISNQCNIKINPTLPFKFWHFNNHIYKFWSNRERLTWDQYEIQMLRISWVTRGSANASTHRQINRSCLEKDHRRCKRKKKFKLTFIHGIQVLY